MPEFSKHIDTFPLEHLFKRLELAGFKLSPADRLRALRILGGPAKIYLDDPARLKQLLAPVLVRSEAEQLRFYEIFDQYYQEISKPWEPDALADSGIKWWRWLLILPALAMLFYAYYDLTQRQVVSDDLAVYIEGPTYGHPGDTVRWEDKTTFPEDGSDWIRRWSYIDVANQREEAFETSQNWNFIVPGIDSGAYLREVRLRLWPPEQDTVYEARLSFAVFCPAAPAVDGIEGETQLEAGQETNFSALLPPGDSKTAAEENSKSESNINWVYSWDFGDGLQDEGSSSVNHAYSQNGQYTLRLTVTDTTTNGFCSTTQTLEIKVGREQAFLPLAELHRDRLSLLASWSWGFYILLGALGLGLLYYWVRWLTRQHRPNDEEQANLKQQEAMAARFAHSDKAPYFIPLRTQNGYITLSGIQLRLGDALRLRQEGLRRELDLTGTLNNTIEKGGFPEIKYHFATQPSEYLCLIDEQSRASHLGQLFRYLADSLKEQDVHLEIYYYRQHFNRFWNSYYPQGRTIDQLQRAYGGHRLLVMGDLHDLINPYAQKTPNLRSAFANVLRQWPLRLLLTPVPPASWSYREKLLARIFNVFPIDSDGLTAAALHIENDGEILSDGNAFDRWQTSQVSIRQDADTEHRNWRRWRFIEEYLANYSSDLVRWFSALAVFPIPSWEMTIAIGQALGIETSYNNLLRLARIPVLQGDRFDERLRREMIAALNPADERLARAAVQKELATVKVISEGSHAHRDLETSLAVQDFALSPENEDCQQAMRYMLQHDLLTPAQESDLDRVVDRIAGGGGTQQAVKKMRRPDVSLRQWLADNWAEEEIIEDNLQTQEDRSDLKRALWLTGAYLVLLFLGWQLGGSDQLYRLAFGEDPNTRVVSAEKPLRNYFFVQESEIIDSAIIYNNQGVDQTELATLGDTVAAGFFYDALRTANSLLHGDGEQFNGANIPYTLANANLSKVYYNAAIQELNAYLSDSLGQAVLPEALDLLDLALRSDTMVQDIWHARGVIHYYSASPEDSSLFYFRLLDSVNYFQNLGYAPNLENLMGRERSRIIAVTSRELGNQTLDLDIEYYLDNIIFAEGARMEISPEGSGTQPESISQAINPGYGSVQFQLEPPRSSPGQLELLRITLSDQDAERIVTTYEEPMNHSWQAQRQPQAPPPTQQTVVKNTFRLEGEVIDAANRVPIPKLTVTLREQPNLTTQKLLEFNTTTGTYGKFILEGDMEDHGPSYFELIVQADGYENYKQVFRSGDQLLTSNPYILKEPIRLQRNIPKPKMVRINGGGFQMGDESGEYSEEERPVHEVSLDEFLIGSYEVTFAEYDLFCEATNRLKPDDNGWGRGRQPVINVSWFDAVEYCNWLSEQHGYEPVYDINPKRGGADYKYNRGGILNGYRLPTEAEWEYAARGGIMLDRSHIYAGGSTLNTVGWYDRNSQDQTHPAGQLRPNNAGTYDMSGNVWEWCNDWFGGYSSNRQNNPTGPSTGSHRIIRGGAWIQQAEDCRVSVRQYRRPEQRALYIGFRLVRK